MANDDKYFKTKIIFDTLNTKAYNREIVGSLTSNSFYKTLFFWNRV